MAKKKPIITVGTYWVNHHYEGSCEVNTSNGYCDAIAEGFGAAMERRGHRWLVDRGELDASPGQWLEPTAREEGGVNTVHFALLASHGNVTFFERGGGRGHIHGFYAPFGIVDPVLKTCQWQSNGTMTNLDADNKEERAKGVLVFSRLGRAKLRWLIVDACNSLQLQRPTSIKLEFQQISPVKIWRRAIDGVRMIMGFTEFSSDGEWTSDRDERFGRRAAAGERLSRAWFDEAYSWWSNDHPVAVAFGKTDKEAEHRVNQDTIADVDAVPAKSAVWGVYQYID